MTFAPTQYTKQGPRIVIKDSCFTQASHLYIWVSRIALTYTYKLGRILK